ncbi:MAG: hypothetical protein GC165_00180 [Armatimonadetes bacterium]|nr:hypothetical protein [Armatimonadota bacterium]
MTSLALLFMSMQGMGSLLPSFNHTDSLAICQKTQSLYVGLDDGIVREIDMKSYSLKRVLQIPGTYDQRDNNRETGFNSILSLTLSPNGKYLAALRMAKEGGFCIELFNLETGNGTLIRNTTMSVPFANDADLYFEADGNWKDPWSIRKWSFAQSSSTLVAKKKQTSHRIWITDQGIVCREYGHMSLYALKDNGASGLALPDDCSGVAEQTDIAMLSSGRHVYIDDHAKVSYSNTLSTTPKHLGTADPFPGLTLPRYSYVSQVQFIGEDSFVSVGAICEDTNREKRVSGGVCTVWNLKDFSRRSFDTGKDSVRSMAASDSIVAIGRSSKLQGEVDLYDLKTGKRLAVISSQYSKSLKTVRITTKVE